MISSKDDFTGTTTMIIINEDTQNEANTKFNAQFVIYIFQSYQNWYFFLCENDVNKIEIKISKTAA